MCGWICESITGFFAAAVCGDMESERTTLNQQQQSGAPSSIWTNECVCDCICAVCEWLTKCVILWRRDQGYRILVIFQGNTLEITGKMWINCMGSDWTVKIGYFQINAGRSLNPYKDTQNRFNTHACTLPIDYWLTGRAGQCCGCCECMRLSCGQCCDFYLIFVLFLSAERGGNVLSSPFCLLLPDWIIIYN